ncbi:DNA (cytosine-5-)-methyltransferase, partial [Allofournierella massiliensis]|uniref:DNA (cytosine-5-)-methyltransferase n=1 Tax=Allofournierella massiliensis TaxID=1650663 RepID=UPI0024B1C269
ARLAEARKPRYLLFENVPGLLSHDGGRTFATILHTLDRLGYGVEWQVLNSKDFGVPQSRRRVYLVGYLDERCRGKILPFTTAAGNALAQVRPGAQGERIYSPDGISCTLAAQAGGFGGRTGLYAVGLPIKEATRKGYKMAYEGDSIDISYYSTNTRRGRVGHKIAHTLTTGSTQGTPCFIDMNRDPQTTEIARCLTAKQNGGIRKHKREASGVLHNGRIRRLTPRECLRLQGWTDERIDKVLAIHSDNQIYKQAGNGVTVNVVEAIGRRLAALDAQLYGKT